jgi:hypothetical protein
MIVKIKKNVLRMIKLKSFALLIIRIISYAIKLPSENFVSMQL